MNDKQLAKWSRMRQMGRTRYVLLWGVLAWGVPTGVIYSIVMGAREGFESSPNEYIFPIILFPIGGIALGVWTWSTAERKYNRAISERSQPATVSQADIDSKEVTNHEKQSESAPASPHCTMNVFLSHASEDKLPVRQLFQRLKEAGFDPWLDEEELLPGQDWQFEIRKAVRASHAVLVCLSPRSVDKEGFIQKEIRHILDIADEKPEGTIFVVPVLLEKCNIPERLSRWQWVDALDDTGFDRLVRALRARAADLHSK